MGGAGQALSILTTVPPDFPALRVELAQGPPPGVRILDRSASSPVELLRRVLAADGDVDAILLNGSGRLDQLAAALLWRRRSRTAVVISECAWKRGTSTADRLANRVGLRAMDSPRVRYCVLSSAELEFFPRTWGVDPRRVAFTPFCYTLTRDDLAAPTSSDGTVFAGGDSMRDYRPLVEAARRLPAPVVLAARELPPALGRSLPGNVDAGPVSHSRFVELTRRASVIVVPLYAGIERSAGQQSYLNGMALGKLVVATDSPGVRDYVEHGSTGLVVPPDDADALTEALAWALDPANAAEVEEMRRRAREVARTRFTPLRYFETLLEVTERAVSGLATLP